jgi:hypothetical protein
MNFRSIIRPVENFIFARRKPIPKGITQNYLELSNEDLGFLIHDTACESLDRAKGEYQSKVHLLPVPWRFAYTLGHLDLQVTNGGFHQFFTNAGGIFDSHLIDDARALGDASMIEVIQSAWDKYQEIDFSDQWENRGKSWDYFVKPYEEGRFEQQDATYYELVAKLSMAERIGLFARANFQRFTA